MVRLTKTLPAICLGLVILVLAAALPGRAVDAAASPRKAPADPRRVVALAPSITEIIFALGQAHRLQGVTRFSDYPAAAQSPPKVGSYKHLDLERIVALRPDLCIGVKDGNPPHVVARLRGLGIPVYLVDPKNLEGVIASVRQIGALLGAKDQARALGADMQHRIDRVKALVAQTEYRPRVFFQIGIAPIISAGNQTFINELITLAGGINLAAGSVPYPRFSREKVLALKPEVIIITSMARGQTFEQVKAQWAGWPNLPAAAQGRIFIVDSNTMDRPTPRLVDGLELLCRLIHPELGSPR
jgi:iron complex transport system substrate-binding protein